MQTLWIVGTRYGTSIQRVEAEKVTEKTYTVRTHDGRELRQYIASESERAFFTWEEARAFIVARLQKNIENAQQAIAHNEALLARVAQYEPGKPYQERLLRER